MLQTDPITGELRLIAPGRSARLGARSKGCPFCAGNEETTPPETARLGGRGGESTAAAWSARSFPNLFPLTAPHEVLVPTPRHVTSWRDLTLPELQVAINLLLARRSALGAGAADRYVHCFVNDGAGGGASIPHVHAQLVVVPRGAWTERLTVGVRDPASCALCALLRDESELVVERGYRYAIAAHPVPRMAGALLIVPAVHDTTISDEPAAELAELVHRAWQALPEGDANMWLVADDEHPSHWYLELQPRTATQAGVELALGLCVIASPAETTAAAARERLAMGRL